MEMRKEREKRLFKKYIYLIVIKTNKKEITFQQNKRGRK